MIPAAAGPFLTAALDFAIFGGIAIAFAYALVQGQRPRRRP